MAIVHNSEVIQEIRNATKIQGGADSVPRVLANQIIPVIEVGSKIVKNARAESTQQSNLNGNSTIFTTPTDQDCYITAASLSMAKDVTADTVDCALRCSINGTFRTLLCLAGLTLTAMQDTTSISYPHPIKVDRGTNILINSSRTAGATRISGAVSFFLDETSNA